MAALRSRCGDYIFVLFLSSCFFLAYLSGRRLDVCHTSTHGVALVRFFCVWFDYRSVSVMSSTVVRWRKSDDASVQSYSSPDWMGMLKALTAAIRAWKAYRLVQVGDNASKTASIMKQTVNSSRSFTRSNSGPISSTPTSTASPTQKKIIDICAVLDSVRTSMSGNVVGIAP